MPETFAPLPSAPASSRTPVFVPLSPKTLPNVASRNGASGQPVPVATLAKSEACAKPTVTLQRNGEIVSGIRIQCGCGEVVELTCVY